MVTTTHGNGGNLEAARGGAVNARGPSTIDYKPVPAAGFKILPAVVRSQLVEKGIIGSKPLCASCLDLMVKERSDGTHYQVGTAWWCNQSKAVLIECQREMKLLIGKKFSPIGTWKVSGAIHHLRDVGGPEVSKWKFSGVASGGGESPPPVVTHEPLDLLPAEVAAPVRGGLSDVWALTSSSNATEYLTAVRIDGGDALLLEGTRTAPTETSLHRSEWKLTTLRAPIDRSETFAFESEPRKRVSRDIGGAGGTRPLMPGS